MLEFETEILRHELNSILSQLRDQIYQINRLKNDNRLNEINKCSDLLQNYRIVRDTFLLELRALTDSPLKASYEKDLAEMNAGYDDCYAEIEIIKNTIDREKIIKEAEEMEESEPNTFQSVQVKGDTVQNKTQEAVESMKRLADEAEAIGLSTVNRLDAQLDRMEMLNRGFDDIAYNTNRAKKTALTLLRNASSDPCIRVLSITLIISFVILVVLIASSRS